MSDAYEQRGSAWRFMNPGRLQPKRITEEGQPCRHCKCPVRKKERTGEPEKRNPSGYYYAYWFVCTNRSCRAMYMVEDAKRFFGQGFHQTRKKEEESGNNRKSEEVRVPFDRNEPIGGDGWPPWIPFEERIGEPHA